MNLLTKNRYSAAIISLFSESLDRFIGSFAAPKYGHLIEFKTDSKSLARNNTVSNRNRIRLTNVSHIMFSVHSRGKFLFEHIVPINGHAIGVRFQIVCFDCVQSADDAVCRICATIQ